MAAAVQTFYLQKSYHAFKWNLSPSMQLLQTFLSDPIRQQILPEWRKHGGLVWAKGPEGTCWVLLALTTRSTPRPDTSILTYQTVFYNMLNSYELEIKHDFVTINYFEGSPGIQKGGCWMPKSLEFTVNNNNNRQTRIGNSTESVIDINL